MEHHAETRELKRALETAGITAKVHYGKGQTLNWLLVEVYNKRDIDDAKQIAEEVTERRGIPDRLLVGIGPK